MDKIDYDNKIDNDYKINYDNNIDYNININNVNINVMKNLIKPIDIINSYPVNDYIRLLIRSTRRQIADIINKKSDKKILIVGPCSIHDVSEAYDYAILLKKIADEVKDKILIIMRVYFEKPRTIGGWKGLINDPDLDNTYNINKGLILARELLYKINKLGLPCACEILDTITPQYLSDLISWGSIGARTVESQVHRQLVSGLSMPVGFKNSTDGNVLPAINAILSSRNKHCFIGVDIRGKPSICTTNGNINTHVILRGGKKPNYEMSNDVTKMLYERELNSSIIIDCSHGNSYKNYKNQHIVFNYVCSNISDNIIGMMLESNINEGKTSINDRMYGVSITDSCIGIEETRTLIDDFYKVLCKKSKL